jgi:hypothetical protein
MTYRKQFVGMMKLVAMLDFDSDDVIFVRQVAWMLDRERPAVASTPVEDLISRRIQARAQTLHE